MFRGIKFGSSTAKSKKETKESFRVTSLNFANAPDRGTDKKIKKEKKKKDKKKKKKRRKRSASSSSSGGRSSSEDDARPPSPPRLPEDEVLVVQPTEQLQPPAEAEPAEQHLDLFNAFGAGVKDFESRDVRKKRERQEAQAEEDAARGVRRVNLDGGVAHERELNPAAYDEDRAAAQLSSSAPGGWDLPSHLRIGDGGRAWRQKATRREREEEKDPEGFKKPIPVKTRGGKKGEACGEEKGGKKGAPAAGGSNGPSHTFRDADGAGDEVDPNEDLSMYEWGTQRKRKPDKGKMKGAGKQAAAGDHGGNRARMEYNDDEMLGEFGGSSKRPVEQDDVDAFGSLRKKFKVPGETSRGFGGKGNYDLRGTSKGRGEQLGFGGSPSSRADRQHGNYGNGERGAAPAPAADHDKQNAAEASLDRNELQARALEAMMNGDGKEYDRLTALVQNKIMVTEQAGGSSSSSKGGGGSRDKDNKSSGKNAQRQQQQKGKGYDLATSVADMQRHEKLGGDDHEELFVDHIKKRGRNFGDVMDDTYEEDGSFADNFVEKKRKRGQPPPRSKGGDHTSRDENNSLMTRDKMVNLKRCHHCFDGQKWSYGRTILAESELAFVALENEKLAFLPGEVIICPWDHVNAMSVNDMDDDTAGEIRNFQKSLVQMLEQASFGEQDVFQSDANDEFLQGKAWLFVEDAFEIPSPDKQSLGAGRHCVVRGYPIDRKILKADLGIYFKQAFREATNEFERTHKSLLEVKNIRSAGGSFGTGGVPKRFPYMFVDFNLEKGYLHPVDQKLEENFVKHVLCGCLEMDYLGHKAYGGPYGVAGNEHPVVFEECLKTVRKALEDYDWTRKNG
eukprot:g7495.t1